MPPARLPPMKKRPAPNVLWHCLLTAIGLLSPWTRADSIDGEQVLEGSEFRGGLIVVVGATSAETILSLAKPSNSLVHVLVADRDDLGGIRAKIRETEAYGRVSAMAWQGEHLPYADDTVNLLVKLGKLDEAEITRVLAPRGQCWERHDGALTHRHKPLPDDIDEWSHARHDATGNAVSRDARVGPPRFLQWEALPQWNRGTKTSSLVSTGGRVFYILDDSDFSSAEPSWSLTARDAHNGVRLWRHRLPSWGGATGGKKVGPAQANRLLAAVGDRVFATLGKLAPVSVLDAATGEVLRVLEATDKTEEFILSHGVLIAMTNETTPAPVGQLRQHMRLVAIDCDTGELLWKHSVAQIMPRALAADEQQVVYHDSEALRSLDLRSGAPRWTSPPTGQQVLHRASANPDSPGAEKGKIFLAPQFAPTLVLYGDVAAFAGGRQLNVVSAANGKELWRADYAASNYSVPVDLFGYDGCLWGPDAGMNLWRPTADDIGYLAYDPRTGAIRKTVKGQYNFRFQHHRCHQMKMVNGKVLAGRAGIEFFDTATGDTVANHWVRGSCFYGIMPANGLLYVPPHDCACYIRAKLSGFMALKSSPSAAPRPIPDDRRLERGPAWERMAEDSGKPAPDDWPAYRHDMARSGKASTRIAPGSLKKDWTAQPGGKLTAPVIAAGRTFVASTNEHRLHAFGAEAGQPLWQYDFDARIDSPPTIHGGLVLCGCRDGSVHALRTADGALAWRFRACPEERLIVSRGQLESTWPVNGGVLVVNDTAYFTAGKSSYLDGGIRLYGLEVSTGRPILNTVLDSRSDDGSENLDEEGVDGFLNDILSSNGERIFMRNNVFDLQGKPTGERITHLHGADGFLSSGTTTRLTWTYAPMYTSPHQGAFYDRRLSRYLFPSGRILAEGDDAIYGFGRNFYEKLNTEAGGFWALFSASKEFDAPLNLTAKEYRQEALKGKYPADYRWWKRIPIQVWAMVKTDNVLFVAGPEGAETISSAALEGKEEAMLMAISPADGSEIARTTLPAGPVWDGMAAANGRLYVALKNGDVVCLKPGFSFLEPKRLISSRKKRKD